MKTSIEKLADEILTIENEPLDSVYFLDVELLKFSIKELISYKLSPGDISLNEKARWVLETGAKHIAEGRPSIEFLQFIAYALARTLNGDEPSLDHAFRLKARNRRPTKDPYADPAVIAYLAQMKEYSCRTTDSNLTQAEATRSLKKAKKNAIDKAYEARWGATPQSHKIEKINLTDIDGRKRSIRSTLKKLGHY